MGIGIGKKSWLRAETNQRHPNDPNPNNFIIQEIIPLPGYTIANIVYPNCTNFEGQKLILFLGEYTLQQLRKMSIDPHFLEKTEPKVVARFRPDEEGLKLMRILIDELDK